MGLKIKKIEKLNKKEYAYDLCTSEGNRTFELDNGVVTHNSLKVPKQFYGFTEDGAGFNGGESLSILSSRYAKSIKRIQNAVIQAVTDAVNLMLLDKGLDSYINKFQIHMLPPTTQDDITRRDNKSNNLSVVRDTVDLLSDIEDASSRLKIVKCMLKNVVSDPDVMTLIQEQIDKLEDFEDVGIDTTPIEASLGTANPGAPAPMDFGSGEEIGGLEPMGGPEMSAGPEPAAPDMDINLPSPSDLGADFTDSTNPEFA